MKYILLSALLVLVSLACATIGSVVMPTSPSENIDVPVTQTAETPAGTTHALSALGSQYCVESYGLWLRSAPEFADNKIMALPQGTRVMLISPGVWSRVYLPNYDEYGYVRSIYLEKCK